MPRLVAVALALALTACGPTAEPADAGDVPDAGETVDAGDSAPTAPRFASKEDAVAAGLLAYYRFDETSGPTLTDAVGSFGGTILGGTAEPAGKVGGAWSRAANFNHGFFLDLGATSRTTFSAAFWWKPTDMTIYAAGDGAGIAWFNKATRWENVLGMNGTPSANRLVLWNATAATAIDGGANLVKDAWHHLAITVSPTETLLYVNGVQTAAMPSTTHQFQLNQGITLLNYASLSANPNNHFGRGVIDDVSVWNVTLLPAAVESLHAYGEAGQPVF